MSRLADAQTAIETIVSTAFTAAGFTATIKREVQAFENYSESELPLVRSLFVEVEPERFAFRQERRRLEGQLALGLSKSKQTATRETVDALLEAIRDGIYADETLTDTVDYVLAEAGQAYTSPDDELIYGVLDVSVEEIF